MDLDKFLQRDIIEFLEKKHAGKEDLITDFEEEITEKGSSLTKKDYVQLLQDALSKKDITTAKNLFKEAQGQLSNASTQEEKKHYTMVIDKLYAQIKDFSVEEDKLKHNIKREEKEEEKLEEETKREKQVLDEEKEELRKIKESNSIKKEKKKNLSPQDKLKEKIKKEMIQSATNISNFIQKKDLKSAMKEYEQMKEKFKSFPKNNKEEKEDLFNDLVSSYYQIKKFEEVVKKENEEKLSKEFNKDKELVEKLKQETLISLKKIKVYLEQDDLKKTIAEYEKLKELFEKVPKNYKNERKIFYQNIITAYKEISNRIKSKKKKDEMLKKPEKLKESKKKEPEKEEIKEESKKEPFEPKGLSKLFELKEELREVIDLLKNKRVHEAELQLLETKHAVDMLPIQNDKEKEKFDNIINKLNHRINFIHHANELRQDDTRRK